MANPNFASLLDTDADAVERPKPMPAGSYHCVVKGTPRRDKSSKKQTDFVEYTLVPTAALEDVDSDELTASGGLEGKIIRATFYITENSLYRLKEFLEHCGIEVSGHKLSALIDEAVNCEVIATLRHEASDDGQSVFARLSKTAPVA